MDLEDVYDDATLARIERAGGHTASGAREARAGAAAPPVGPAHRAGAALAIAAATAAGLREVFDPPERVRQEELDPWTGGGTHPRVRFHWHPVPKLAVAEVLW
jgi:hypothetical protein